MLLKFYENYYICLETIDIFVNRLQHGGRRDMNFEQFAFLPNRVDTSWGKVHALEIVYELLYSCGIQDAGSRHYRFWKIYISDTRGRY